MKTVKNVYVLFEVISEIDAKPRSLPEAEGTAETYVANCLCL